MDSTQNNQSAPLSPEPQNGHKMAYIIVGVFSLVVLGAVAVPFTLNLMGGDQVMVDKQEVAEDTQLLNAYRDGTSAEAQQAYLKNVDERLAENNVSDAARDLLLLRKALVMATARGTEAQIKANAEEAIKILKDFINRPQNDSTSYFRDFSIVALARLEMQCCSVSSELMDGSVPLYDTYSRYQSAGYSPSLSALLTLDDSTTKLSEARKIDAMNRLNSVDIAAKIIIGYADQLKADTKSRLLQELNGALNEFASLKPLTYTDASIVTYEAQNKLALAYDVYKSNQPDGKSAAVNTAIDRQYEDAADSIRAQMKAASDVHGLNEVLFYNQMNYLESIDRRYGDAVDQTKHARVIQTLLDILKTEPTVSAVGNLYFRGAQAWKQSNPDELRKLSAYTHFMDQSKTNSEVAAYLKSIGVTW